MKNKPYPTHFLQIILFWGGETRFGSDDMQQIYMNQPTTRIQHRSETYQREELTLKDL